MSKLPQRLVLSALGLVAATGIARAAVDAEPIPAEFMQQFVPFAVQIIDQQFPNPAVKVTLDGEKATGYHVQEIVGLVAIPDKNLTAKAVQDAGEKDVPVGILATRALTIQDKDAAVPKEKVAVADLNGMFKVPVFFVGVKGKGEERTLYVYGKDKTPLTSTVLKKKEGAAAAEPVTLKLSNIDLEKQKADVTVGVPGYEGTLKLAVQDF